MLWLTMFSAGDFLGEAEFEGEVGETGFAGSALTVLLSWIIRQVFTGSGTRKP